MKIRAIGFDYAGVIDDQSFDFKADIAKIIGVPLDELKKIYFQNNALLNVNNIPYDKFWLIILKKLNKQEKSVEVLKYIASKFKLKNKINPKMVKLVDRLRVLDYKVGLLSNNSREKGIKIRQAGLKKHFDVIVISAEVGYQKPSPEIFNLFTKKLGIRPNELIFIDNSQQSLRQAKEIGFYPILFKNYIELVKTLISLGILPDRDT